MLERLHRVLDSRPTVRRMFGGGAWLGVEQALRLGLGLLGGVWVARYLGPGDFGLLNAALAVVAILGGLAMLGLNTILVREIAMSPREAPSILATAFHFKLGVSALLWLGCVVLVANGFGPDDSGGGLLPVAALSLIFQSFDVVERKLQAEGSWRRLAEIRCAGVLASFALRVVLIVGEAPVVFFALAGVCEVAVAAVGLAWVMAKAPGGFSGWSFSASRAKSYVAEGLPLVGAGLAIQVQGYSDQIMLGAFRGSDEVGHYAAALRIVLVFTFVPMVLQAVAMPEIAKARADDAALHRVRLHRLYRLATLAGLATAVPLALVGPMLATWLFGDAYAVAGALLPWFALRLFLANLGVARGVFLNTEGMARWVLTTAASGAVVNVGLNLIFIPRWGATGAVAASLFSFSLTTFGLEWAHERARWNLRLMVAAMLRPWRALD